MRHAGSGKALNKGTQARTMDVSTSGISAKGTVDVGWGTSIFTTGGSTLTSGGDLSYCLP